MSMESSTKKRKSTDGTDKVTKKVKTTSPLEKRAPLKSALKKSSSMKVKDVSQENARPSVGEAAQTKVSKAAASKRGAPQRSRLSTMDDSEGASTPLSEDQTAALLAGFSSSEEEDEDEEDDEGKGRRTSAIPKPPTTGAVQKRIKQAIAQQDDPETTPGVIYLGRIPHGFYEQEMRAYFAQFGRVTNLRLARNRRTGKSKHFAFIEFASGAVADIVVKTMDKYLMFGHILQARRVANDQVKADLFKGPKKHVVPRNMIERKSLARGMVREDWEKKIAAEDRRRAQKAEKLKDLGYDFDMPALRSVSSVAIKPREIEASAEEELKHTEQEEAQDEEAEQSPTMSAPAADAVVGVTVETKKRPANSKPKAKKVVKKVKVSVD